MKTVISSADFINLLNDLNHETIENYEIVQLIPPQSSSKVSINAKNGIKKISNCIFTGNGQFGNFELNCRIHFIDCDFNKINEEDEFNFFSISKFQNQRHSILGIENNYLNFHIERNNSFNLKVIFSHIDITTLHVAGDFLEEITFSKIKSYLIINGAPGNYSNFRRISFYNSSELKSILVRESNISESLCFNDNVPISIIIADGYYKKIYFQNVFQIPNIRLEGGNKKKESLKIDEFELNFIREKSEIQARFLTINKLKINRYSNIDGTLTFQGVKIIDSFSFEDSDLENVKFNDVDFHKSRVIFDRSYITSAKFANILWPNNHEISSSIINDKNDSKIEIELLRSKTEVYRQLKKVYLNDSNNVEALKFYRNEMSSYWERVQIDKKDTKENRILICVNKYVSDFGQSYFLPILWLFVIHLVFCIIIWNIEACSHCHSGTFCENDFLKGVAQYFSWINPIFKVPERWTNISISIGFFMRLSSGFFIYHLVKATRKFGKL
jgi:hypothetical protein